MTDPRSSFRFRMPRLRPSVPPPRPTTAPESPLTTTQTPARRPPIRPQGLTPLPQVEPSTTPAPAPPPLPIQPQGIAPAPAPAPTAEPSTAPATQVIPALVAPTQAVAAPPPPADLSLPKPAIAKAPESTKTTSQPSSPSQTGIQSRVSSHPVSPSRMSTQPRVLPKDTSRGSTQSQPTSQLSSPARVQPSQTASPPRSPSRLASRPTNNVSLSPSPPIVTTTQVQPEEILFSQRTQPRQPPSSRPIPDTAQANSSVKSIEPQPNTENTPESPQKPKSIDGSQAPLCGETSGGISNFVNKTTTSSPKQYMNGKPVSVITLAGENIGTSMRICSGATKREIAIRIFRRYKVNPDESGATTTDGEENSKGKKSEKDLKAIENQEKNAYINCNIQVVNNSMVFSSSITERNPGVQLDSSRKPEVNKPKNKNTESMDTHKAKDNITPSQKLTYEPTIRRRCLRGLFMESSDSDLDDPEKPRRHGCRYICGEKSNKDDKTDALGFE